MPRPRKKNFASGSGPARASSRERPGGEFLYGINPVEAALRAGRRPLGQLFLKTGRPGERLAALRALAEGRGLRVGELEPAELERRGGSPDHQGALLSCGALPALGERECLAAPVTERALLLALDEVQDPRNFGAVVRSAAVFGITGLVAPRHHSAPLSPVVSKASAGYLESFPIYTVANLARFLASCRKKGYWIAGAAEDGETPLHEFERDRPLVVVLGNEGRGLRPLVRKQCDFELSIHLPGEGSLNVSAAAAVLLYHLTQP